MSDWDASESSGDEQPKSKPKPKPEETQTKSEPKKETVEANDWDASESSGDEQPKQTEKQIETQPETNNNNNNDNNTAEDEEAKLRKMKKKMQNYKKKQKRKNKRKNKKKQQAPPIPKNQNELIEMDSSDSDSESDKNNNKKNKKKMESYEDRMRTDNDILFEGHKTNNKSNNNKKKAEKKADEGIMLSGQVTLKNFPLGSSRDCTNLATQISKLLDQKLFEESINANDVFLFYKTLLSSNILNKLDMVDTKELVNKMNALLAAKQKAWHKAKNPKNKKKKKAQWIVGDKFENKLHKKTGHHDGAYDSDEFSLFD